MGERTTLHRAIYARAPRCGPETTVILTTVILKRLSVRQTEAGHGPRIHARRNKYNITALPAMPRLNKRAQREQDALAALQQGVPKGLSESDDEKSEPEIRSKLGFVSVGTITRGSRPFC